MASTIDTIQTELTSSDMEEKALTIISDAFPNLDCGPGTPVYEMIIRPTAVLWARQADGVTELINALDLNNISTAPESDIDRLLTRYFVTRRTGSYVTGIVRVVFGSKIDVYISAGDIWEASDNRTYEVVSDHFVTADELEGDDDTGYILDVAVKSTGTTSSYNADENDAVTVTSSCYSAVLRAYFLTSTSDGGVEESNTVFYNRAKDELAARNLYCYKSVKALLLDTFDTIQEVLPVGIRDSEMLRDIVDVPNIGKIHIGGKCDIYIRPTSFITVSGYQAPLGFPLTYKGKSLTDDVEGTTSLQTTWNSLTTSVTVTDIGYRMSTSEKISGLSIGSDMTTLTADLASYDSFIAGNDYSLMHTDNIVKIMWPLVVTVSVTVEDSTELSSVEAVGKQVISAYINALSGSDYPQVSEIIHLLRDNSIPTVHLPIEMRCYYLTDELRMESFGLNKAQYPGETNSSTMLEPQEDDSLKFVINDANSQISMRTCCWYTNTDLINVQVVD